MHSTDILIIGTGIAGLSYTLKCAQRFPNKKIIVITKSQEDETNTKYAQGGIAVVTDFLNDSFDKHIKDTLIAGDGLCNQTIVDNVIKEGSERVKEMIQWGAHFDKDEQGQLLQGKEGGHSEHRVLYHKDATGAEIERALLAKVKALSNVNFLTHYFVIDLITEHHLGKTITRVTEDIHCFGVYVLNRATNKIEKVAAKITLLATGGVGQVYKNTTNPTIATGDGIAMLYRAKGRVRNMEMVQFHPTALYQTNENPAFLITEAMRGEGAELCNKAGEYFMKNYDQRGSLAPRDIVARAIDNELKRSGDEHVLLDTTKIDPKKAIEHFPNIYAKCLKIGIDFTQKSIPVVPAAHYICGGILTNQHGQTSIQHLFATGECASTGLHGANRLASNSLLEAIVFSHRAYLKTAEIIDNIELEANLPAWDAEGTTDPKEMVLITQSLKELKEIMTTYVGIVRSDIRLKRALNRLFLLHQEIESLYATTRISPQLCELRNLITIGYLITRSAAVRHESRGLHYTTDYLTKRSIVEDTIL